MTVLLLSVFINYFAYRYLLGWRIEKQAGGSNPSATPGLPSPHREELKLELARL